VERLQVRHCHFNSNKFEKQFSKAGAHYQLSYFEKQAWQQETGGLSDLRKSNQGE